MQAIYLWVLVIVASGAVASVAVAGWALVRGTAEQGQRVLRFAATLGLIGASLYFLGLWLERSISSWSLSLPAPLFLVVLLMVAIVACLWRLIRR